MSNSRFSPARSGQQGQSVRNDDTNIQRPTQRVPVSRMNSRDTYNEEGQRGYQEPPNNNPPKLNIPNYNKEDDYEEEYSEKRRKKKKSGALKITVITLIVVISIIVIAVGVTYFMSGKDLSINVPQTLGGGQNTTTNALTQTNSLINNAQTTPSKTFDGQPVPIKWPSDIQPTRMEVLLNPINGDPVLLLIGDKAGLGTVLRVHDGTNGDLKGFYVIVPDNPALTQPTTQNNVQIPNDKTQQNTQQTQQTQQTTQQNK